MANVVITSTATYLKVIFNDESTKANLITLYVSRSSFFVYQDSGMGVHFTSEANCLLLCTVGANGALIVDSVDAVTPTDGSDLLDKLGALIL